ncbi:hypothetical protein ABZ621_17770 [Streptomyces sp. NPDC007863]|uniref:hypothetical protein n=1 Tax=Streptomyces sp. NPDC007863 TaxID=3154894 RepID=UPI0033D03C5F
MSDPSHPGGSARRVVLATAVIVGLCGAVALVTVLCLHLFGATGSQEADTKPPPVTGDQGSPERPYDPFWPPAPPAMPPQPLPPNPGTYR